MNAQQAIGRSIAIGEPVKIPTTDENMADLLSECDGHVNDGLGTHEFWGEDFYGNPWRVYLVDFEE
jgi:hypothetical protein